MLKLKLQGKEPVMGPILPQDSQLLSGTNRNQDGQETPPTIYACLGSSAGNALQGTPALRDPNSCQSPDGTWRFPRIIAGGP